MKLPYILRRLQRGSMVIPLHGELYEYDPIDNAFYGTEGRIIDKDLLTWLMASKALYFEKRQMDNDLIRRARQKARIWLIYAITTAPVIYWILHH